jgi:type VI secretion system protein ImpF
MVQREIERTVQPSLIDRLTDLEPRIPGDPRITVAESVRQFKASVQRDLEWLLNTRRIPEPAPSGLDEVEHSLYAFGLPDISSISRDSPHARQRLLRQIEDAIAIFEPRLTDVKITMLELEGEQRRRELHFAVEATLRMDPNPEHVVFDTVLHFSNGEYELAGVHGA